MSQIVSEILRFPLTLSEKRSHSWEAKQVQRKGLGLESSERCNSPGREPAEPGAAWGSSGTPHTTHLLSFATCCWEVVLLRVSTTVCMCDSWGAREDGLAWDWACAVASVRARAGSAATSGAGAVICVETLDSCLATTTTVSDWASALAFVVGSPPCSESSRESISVSNSLMFLRSRPNVE